MAVSNIHHLHYEIVRRGQRTPLMAGTLLVDDQILQNLAKERAIETGRRKDKGIFYRVLTGDMPVLYYPENFYAQFKDCMPNPVESLVRLAVQNNDDISVFTYASTLLQ